MGKTRFDVARTFLQELKEEKGTVVPFNDLRIEMMKKIGSHERRTVKPYLRLMLETKLISEEGKDVRIN